MKQLKKGTRLSKTLVAAVISNIVADKVGPMDKQIEARQADLIELAQTVSTESYQGTPDQLTDNGMFPLVDTLTFVNSDEEDVAKRIHFNGMFPIPYRTLSNGTVVLNGEQYEQVVSLSELCEKVSETEIAIQSRLSEAFEKFDNAKDLVEEHKYVLDYLPEEYVEDAEAVETTSLDDLLGGVAA